VADEQDQEDGMTDRETILAAYRFTQMYAEKLAADLTDDELTVQPHAGMNHAAWVLGHVALGSDFVALLLGEPTVTGEAWMATFGPGSTPVDDRAAYPSKDELLATMRTTHARAIKLLAAATAEQLDLPNGTPFFPVDFPTVGALITHLMTTHAALHLGQLSAWRRALGKGAVLGV
jgi:hypothetical protein